MANDYERARAERIAANNAKLASLGIAEAAQQLQVVADVKRPPKQTQAPRQKRKMYEIEVTVRRSGRLQGEQPEYNEENLFARELGIDRLDLIARPRRRRVGVDPSALQSIRERRVREVDGDDAEVPRGPIDSGLGVRIQGGRVYDSKYGVTCHWCRQKTLEEHVTCTHPDCGGGRRLAVSFCKLCLKNRHGEDIAAAEASDRWVCPRCRGSCGDGCVACCNCGPCRKALGLAPTHQIIGQARAAGFDNVHDYLVHQRTGESAEAIAARKRGFDWGAWLDVPFEPVAAEAGAELEEDSEATESEAATGDGSETETEDESERTENEEEEAASPAAAAAVVQLDARAVPRGAGATLLLYGALRWHALAAGFCAAAKALAPKQSPAASQRRVSAAAKAKPDAAPAKPAKGKATAVHAQRRSARGRSTAEQQQQEPARRAAKVTSFFQTAATASHKAAPAAKVAEQAAAPGAAAKVAAGAPPTRPSGRLGMRARR